MKLLDLRYRKISQHDMKNFWEEDLEVVEARFIKSRPITSLPAYLDDRIPPQGSVILDRIYIPKRSFLDKIRSFF